MIIKAVILNFRHINFLASWQSFFCPDLVKKYFQNEQQDEKKVQPKQEPMNMNQSSQEPKKKKLRLEQMGFGNMGAGFGCSQFVANQGEEMPTMLQMGYAGEGPGGMGADEGTGFGDYADDGKIKLFYLFI